MLLGSVVEMQRVRRAFAACRRRPNSLNIERTTTRRWRDPDVQRDLETVSNPNQGEMLPEKHQVHRWTGFCSWPTVRREFELANNRHAKSIRPVLSRLAMNPITRFDISCQRNTSSTVPGLCGSFRLATRTFPPWNTYLEGTADPAESTAGEYGWVWHGGRTTTTRP